MSTINCRGRLIDLSKPKVMAIVNVTPDSFYSGSRCPTTDAALARADEALAQGADILDLGAYSTRPGADEVSADEEVEPSCARGFGTTPPSSAGRHINRYFPQQRSGEGC